MCWWFQLKKQDGTWKYIVFDMLTAHTHTHTHTHITQSSPTPGDPVDCSPPGSSVHGILQARILKWVTISFSRGSPRPRDRTRVSHIGGRHFNLWATREAQKAHDRHIKRALNTGVISVRLVITLQCMEKVPGQPWKKSWRSVRWECGNTLLPYLFYNETLPCSKWTGNACCEHKHKWKWSTALETWVLPLQRATHQTFSTLRTTTGFSSLTSRRTPRISLH